jgi:hypothetical protein
MAAEVKVLGLTGLQNAHVSDPIYDSDYSICCSGIENLGTDSSGTTFLRYSSSTNAHTEYNSYSNYPLEAKISSSALLSCTYQPSCEEGYTCLASISADTNAHIAACSSADYGLKICCNVCNGSIMGYVKDQDNMPLEGAKVEAFKGLTKVAESPYTETDGSYEMSVPCGTYNLIASKEDYVSDIVSNVNVSTVTQQNFTLNYGLVCEEDCSYLLDDRCHQECHNVNNCSFYDDTAKTKCNGAKIGWEVEYDPGSGELIECCTGSPKNISEVKATVDCPYKNLIKFHRIVYYKGEPIRMVTVVCGGQN